MATYHGQRYDAVRTVGSDEIRRAILVGQHVKIGSGPDEYGYLYKGELYIIIERSDARP